MRIIRVHLELIDHLPLAVGSTVLFDSLVKRFYFSALTLLIFLITIFHEVPSIFGKIFWEGGGGVSLDKQRAAAFSRALLNTLQGLPSCSCSNV